LHAGTHAIVRAEMILRAPTPTPARAETAWVALHRSIDDLADEAAGQTSGFFNYLEQIFYHHHAALPQKFSDRNEVVASDKNPTEGEVGEVQRASRYDLVRALAPRYAHVGKLEKRASCSMRCAS
jgi:hypothetical protein